MELELFHNHFNDLIIKVQTLEEECDALQANLEAAGDEKFRYKSMCWSIEEYSQAKVIILVDIRRLIQA